MTNPPRSTGIEMKNRSPGLDVSAGRVEWSHTRKRETAFYAKLVHWPLMLGGTGRLAASSAPNETMGHVEDVQNELYSVRVSACETETYN
jgi:hypothetical protein